MIKLSVMIRIRLNKTIVRASPCLQWNRTKTATPNNQNNHKMHQWLSVWPVGIVSLCGTVGVVLHSRTFGAWTIQSIVDCCNWYQSHWDFYTCGITCTCTCCTLYIVPSKFQMIQYCCKEIETIYEEHVQCGLGLHGYLHWLAFFIQEFLSIKILVKI